VIKLIESDGWKQRNTEGSHRQFGHPMKPGKVTIAGHLSLDVPKGTLQSILKQAGVKQ
jgi:predicted RNA binding protein YcfA (HicA-like mRNA interferase family)